MRSLVSRNSHDSTDHAAISLAAAVRLCAAEPFNGRLIFARVPSADDSGLH